MEQVKGISRCQGACPLRGACGVLDCGFRGGFTSSTPIRTLLLSVKLTSRVSFCMLLHEKCPGWGIFVEQVKGIEPST